MGFSQFVGESHYRTCSRASGPHSRDSSSSSYFVFVCVQGGYFKPTLGKAERPRARRGFVLFLDGMQNADSSLGGLLPFELIAAR